MGDTPQAPQALDRYELSRSPPHPLLRGYVRDYVGYRDWATEHVRRRELPVVQTVVIINLGSPWHIFDATDDGPSDTPLVRGSFIAGVHPEYVWVASTGPACCLQIDLEPMTAYRLFGIPMDALTASTTELGDVLGSELQLLREMLAEAPSWEHRFRRMDAYLLKRLRDARRQPSEAVAWAYRQLRLSGGTRRVDSLARELGVSRKRLSRDFRREIGAPTKQVAQLLRFGQALEALPTALDEDVGLSQVALDCGYADQAHMNREFRRFSGWTPGQYLRVRAASEAGLLD